MKKLENTMAIMNIQIVHTIAVTHIVMLMLGCITLVFVSNIAFAEALSYGVKNTIGNEDIVLSNEDFYSFFTEIKATQHIDRAFFESMGITFTLLDEQPSNIRHEVYSGNNLVFAGGVQLNEVRLLRQSNGSTSLGFRVEGNAVAYERMETLLGTSTPIILKNKNSKEVFFDTIAHIGSLTIFASYHVNSDGDPINLARLNIVSRESFPQND